MSWASKRVKDIADLVNGFPFASEDFADAGDVPLVRIRDILGAEFETFVPRTAIPPEALIRDADVVIGMDGDFNSVLWKRGRAALNQRVCLLRTRDDNDPRFLAYAIPSHLTEINELIYSTTVKHLSSRDVASIRLRFPDAQEQKAIADYLDRETAQIDTLIAKQEQLIATLRERRDALWSDAFDNAAQSYGTIPLRRVIDSIVDGPFGSSLTSSHYSESGARVIRLGNIGINSFRNEDHAYIPLEYFEKLRQHEVMQGDVVVAGLGDERMPLGRATVVPEIGPAIVKADCYRVRPSLAVDAHFLAWALSAPPTREQVKLLSRGSTRSRLNTSVVREAMIPAVPRTEQSSLIRDHQDRASNMNTLISRAEKLIALARERRSALITAAVTGQIDVHTAA